MLRYVPTMIILIFLCHCLHAQTVSGLVYDGNQVPIDYADIINVRTNAHTHSDENGRFLLENTKVGDTLNVIHFFYENAKFIVKDHDSKIRVSLAEKEFNLNQVTVKPRKDPSYTLSKIDLSLRPVQNAQELLNRVPGLFIGQHAGGGKAEQIFLRGFDIDHGTDINLTVDGMPINMVSHAHGQGYADMHFIIPDVLENISYTKGPYDINRGNLATAGNVNFSTKDRLASSSISHQIGSFNRSKTLASLNLIDDQSNAAYISTEWTTSDGPFEASQHFKRLNVFGKWTHWTPSNDRISLSASMFTSAWDASGQIPERAVKNGLISRFGAIDSTEGGKTNRINFTLNHSKYIDDKSYLKTDFYFSNYGFDLFSNFTFFLNDSINGDQIRQVEKRNLYGFNSTYFRNIWNSGDAKMDIKAGIGWRYDDVNDISLDRTLNRKTIVSSIKKGNIDESNFSTFAELNYSLHKLNISAGARTDMFTFLYNDLLSARYDTKSETARAISPKATISYTMNDKTQLFAKVGKGFHSNDTRVVTDANSLLSLPAAWGTDIGANHKITNNLFLQWTLWRLKSDQEFVYVGDEGIVEPSGKSLRQGIEASLRYQPFNWMILSADANYTRAKSLDSEPGETHIPLAAPWVNSGSVSIYPSKMSSLGLHLRNIGDRPANEDNSIIAQGYAILDFNAKYQWKQIEFTFEVKNVLNTAWNETQFATNSRLQNELIPVEEIHFTPGEPRAFYVAGRFIF
jgi:outer membrane cobalamin receptor